VSINGEVPTDESHWTLLSTAAKKSLPPITQAPEESSGAPSPEQGTSTANYAPGVGTPIELGVYNSRLEAYRRVVLQPSATWGGQGLLGCSIRFGAYEEESTMAVWHILNLQPGSPAEAAGLIAQRDYIIGSPTTFFCANEDLLGTLRAASGGPLKLFVYNVDLEATREVTVVPGEGGGLGCEIGFGSLHLIPKSVLQKNSREKSQSPLTPLIKDPTLPRQQTTKMSPDPSDRSSEGPAKGIASRDQSQLKELHSLEQDPHPDQHLRESSLVSQPGTHTSNGTSGRPRLTASSDSSNHPGTTNSTSIVDSGSALSPAYPPSPAHLPKQVHPGPVPHLSLDEPSSFL
jgi:hypothetical protein